MKAVNQGHRQEACARWGAAACACLMMAAQSALANPTGGTVTAGNASITSQGPTTTITQTSSRAIINWKDFSINPNEITQFKQPSANSFTLNRVTGGNPSQILGTLKANGNIYIINPNGILFGKNSRVDVGGLVASTSQISDQSFLSGKTQSFTPGHAGASIINEGTISVKNAGLAVLVSPTVINSGVIQADLGTVQIASADHFTLDPYGDHLITFDAGKQLSQGLLENEGEIRAQGGKVYLTAQAADGMLENIVNMDGYIEASSVSKHNGKVVLQGYGNTQINVNGKINVASAKNTAGVVQVTAKKVYLGKNSVINASGYSGGGTVNIGGEYQGGGALAHADNVYMDTGAMIKADALHNGKGGTITLWSDENTDAHGSMFARGGEVSGDGGFIETSSHLNLNTAGATINASSPHGRGGDWLLDPMFTNVTNADVTTPVTGFNDILQGGTNITIWAADDISMDFNLANSMSWTSTATFNARADFDHNGVGTVLFTSTGLITAPSGTVNFYYNPAVFTTPTAYAQVSAAVFNPYMLVNDDGTQLQAIGTNSTTLSRYYALNENLSAGLGAFTSLGGQGSGRLFTGHFTGAVYQDDTNNLTQFTISNLTINAPAIDQVGLFGNVSGGSISNVVLSNPTITGKKYVGGVIGEQSNGTVISDISVQGGSVTGTDAGSFSYVGGVFGELANSNTGVNASGSFSNSATVTGNSDVGGIIGAAEIGNYAGNYTNSGSVNASGSNTFNFGGVAGGTQGTWTNANLINTGDVNAAGAYYVGGVIGTAYYATMNGGSIQSTAGAISGGDGAGGAAGGLIAVNFGPLNNVALTMTRASPTTFLFGDTAGGLFGYSNGNITTSSITVSGDITVSGTHSVGGLFGDNAGVTFSVASPYTNTIKVVNTGDQTGGLMGVIETGSTIVGDLSNAADVTGTTNTGGLFGYVTSSSLNYNYAQTSGTIIGTDQVGGLVGTLDNSSLSNGTVTTPNISGSNNVGGAVGLIKNTLTITDISVTGGTVTGTSNVGGVLGYVNTGTATVNGTLSNSSHVTGFNSVGGVMGASNCCDSYNGTWSNSGTVTGTGGNDIGGVIGFAQGNYSASLTNSGDVLAPLGNQVGGVLGREYFSTFTGNLVNTGGNISGHDSVGGLVGFSDNGNFSGAFIVTRSSASTITSNQLSGGLFGLMTGGFLPGGAANAGIITPSSVTVSGPLTIIGAGYNGGLIGYAADPSITWPSLVTNVFNVNSTGDYVGGAIGYLDINNALPSAAPYFPIMTGDLSNNADVSGVNNVGGVFGYVVDNTLLTGAYTQVGGTITGTGNNVGGVIGQITNSTISGSNNFQSTGGNVSGVSNVGGLIGQVTGTTVFNRTGATSISNAAAVSGSGSSIGGLFGLLTTGTFSPATSGTLTNTGTVTGTGTASEIGGIIGYYTYASPSVTDNYAMTNSSSGTVTGASGADVGGIFGKLHYVSVGNTLILNGTIDNSATVSSAGNAVGGIYGLSDGVTFTSTLSNSGPISSTGSQNVGGIGGDSTSNIFNNITINDSGNVNALNAIRVGGMFGIAYADQFDNSTLNLTATSIQGKATVGGNFVGGLIGFVNTSGPFGLTNSLITVGNNLTVSGYEAVGGLIGWSSGSFYPASISMGSGLIVTGNDYVGGLLGAYDGLSPGFAFPVGGYTNTGTITATADHVGGIIGMWFGANGVSPSNISQPLGNTGSVSGTQDVGGIFGNVQAGTLSGNFSNSGSVTGTDNVGGIIGLVQSFGLGTILDTPLVLSSTSGAVVTGTSNVGGLIGNIASGVVYQPTSTFTNAGEVTSTAAINSIGGIFGSLPAGLIITNELINNGYVHDTNATGIGGIMGLDSGNVFTQNLTNNGSVTGKDYTGGLFGQITGTPTFSAAWLNTGTITGRSQTAGLVGSTLGATFTGSLENQGNITGPGGYVAGVLGEFGGTITNTASLLTSKGNISGFNQVGGLIGRLDSAAVINALSLTVTNAVGPVSVTSDRYAGGLFGQMDPLSSPITAINTMVNDSTVFSDNTDNYAAGGILGFSNGNTINANMTNNGSVNGLDAGGIAGNIYNTSFTGTLQNYGSITGGDSAGGIVGHARAGSTMSGPITVGNGIDPLTIGTHNTVISVGYVVGYMIDSDLASTSVTVNSNVSFDLVDTADAVGGIVGTLDSGGTLSGFSANPSGYSIADPITVTNEFAAGSVIGVLTNNTFSDNINSLANISANGFVGGVIGSVNNSTVSGTLTSTNNVSSNDVTASVGGNIGEFDNSTLSGSLILTNNASVQGASSLVANTSSVGGNIGKVALSSNFASGAQLFTDVNTTVSGENIVGGMVGNFTASSYNATNPYINNATVTSNAAVNTVGGMFGKLPNGITVTNALTNNASVTDLNALALGGIIGSVTGVNFTQDLTNNGNVIGNNNVGGLVGYALNDSFTGINTFYGTVNGNLDVGGIVGTLDNSSLTHAGVNGTTGHGTVTGNTNTGGIAGQLINGSSINQAYNISNNTVNGIIDVTGGIAGFVDGTSSISNVLFGGTLNAFGTSAGGIVGVNNGTITNALSAGSFGLVTATYTGALVGTNNGTLANYIGTGQPDSFFDIRNYPGYGAVGTGNAGGTGTGDYVELAGPTMYTTQGWDFATVWDVSAGNYPVLRFCPSCSVPLSTAPVPPTPTPTPIPSFTILASLYNAILTQTVNALNTYDISQDSLLADAAWLATTGLNIIPATTILNTMDLSSMGSALQSAMNFMNNTVVLEWLDNNQVDLQSPQGTQLFMILSLQATVKALEGAQSCPVNGGH